MQFTSPSLSGAVLVKTLNSAGFRDQDIVRVPVEIDGEITNGLIVRFATQGIPTYRASSLARAGSLALAPPDDSRAQGINEHIPLASFHREMDYGDYVIRPVGGEIRQ
jgi:hypothetical protein